MSNAVKSCVAWSDHGKLLAKGAKELGASGKFSDLEIRCRDKVFKVHKLLLSFFTDYFNNCDGLWIRMDTNPVYLEHIINFVYFGEILVNYEDMEGFLKACKQYGINLFQVRSNKETSKTEQDPISLSSFDSSHFHERYELNDFQLLCRKCYKCFATKQKLNAHTWGCERELLHKCDICSRAFKFPAILRDHMRTHDKKRPFQCPHEGCDRDFKVKTNMLNHIKVVHEKQRFKCEYCDHPGWTSRLAMDYHIKKNHLKEAAFPCKECEKSYPTKHQLKTHTRINHTGPESKKKWNEYIKQYNQKNAAHIKARKAQYEARRKAERLLLKEEEKRGSEEVTEPQQGDDATPASKT